MEIPNQEPALPGTALHPSDDDGEATDIDREVDSSSENVRALLTPSSFEIMDEDPGGTHCIPAAVDKMDVETLEETQAGLTTAASDRSDSLPLRAAA
eukprot:scaffold193669_cov22-Prasinocladus_malaysianus.AAC.1